MNIIHRMYHTRMFTSNEMRLLTFEMTHAAIDRLVSIGAKIDNPFRKLSCRWIPEPLIDPSVISEIYAAISQECEAEIFQQAFSEAQRVRPSALWKGEDLVSTLIKTHANSLCEVSFIFVSPTMLTILQSEDAGFERMQGDAPYEVGRLGSHRIVVDQYANPSTPIIIAAPGWVSYRSDDCIKLSGERRVNGEFIFQTSLRPMLSPSLIKTIDVEVLVLCDPDMRRIEFSPSSGEP